MKNFQCMVAFGILLSLLLMTSCQFQNTQQELATLSAGFQLNNLATPTPTPTSTTSASPSATATPSPTPQATSSSGGKMAGVNDPNWIDPQFGGIVTEGGHSNPAIDAAQKKDVKIRIIFFKDSNGNITSDNPTRDGQFVMDQLRASYQLNGKSFFNFVLVSSTAEVNNARFMIENNSEITSVGNEYAHDEYFTLIFVRSINGGGVNGVSPLYVSPSQDSQFILFAYGNIVKRNPATNVPTGFITTITHEFGHMLGMPHGSNPNGGSASTTGMTSINRYLVGSGVPQSQLCDENFNHYIFPNQDASKTINNVYFEGFKWHLYPVGHPARTIIHDNAGRSYTMTRLWDCYYKKKLLGI
jgi:hypothetical protein